MKKALEFLQFVDGGSIQGLAQTSAFNVALSKPASSMSANQNLHKQKSTLLVLSLNPEWSPLAYASYVLEPQIQAESRMNTQIICVSRSLGSIVDCPLQSVRRLVTAQVLHL
jgi:hypothetical protein